MRGHLNRNVSESRVFFLKITCTYTSSVLSSVNVMLVLPSLRFRASALQNLIRLPACFWTTISLFLLGSLFECSCSLRFTNVLVLTCIMDFTVPSMFSIFCCVLHSVHSYHRSFPIKFSCLSCIKGSSTIYTTKSCGNTLPFSKTLSTGLSFLHHCFKFFQYHFIHYRSLFQR